MPFLEIDLERDDVDLVAVGLSFLLLDVEEFARGCCLSGSSDFWFDRRVRLSGMVCKVQA